MKKYLSILILSLFVLSACAVQEQTPQVEEQKELRGSYKIGVMQPLTGDAAAYGIAEQRPIKISFY